MKYLFLAACSMAMVLGTYAQNIGLYSPGNIQSGGTIVVPANSTNVFWTYALTNGVQNGVITTNTYNQPASNTVASNTNLLTCNLASFDYVGFTWSYIAGSNATCQAFKSFDFGQTFEATPSFSYSGPAASASAWITNAALDVHGATTLAFVIQNRGAIPLTNHLTEVNLKAATIQVTPAGINPGTTPGNVIHVPNFN